jgi:hypothetical protein
MSVRRKTIMKKRFQCSVFSFFVLALCSMLFALSFAQADDIATRSGNVILIEPAEHPNQDWAWTDTFPQSTSGIKVKAVLFTPGAADDHCVIEEGSVNGPSFFDVTCPSAEEKGFPFAGATLRPVMDYSEGTYSSGAKIMIILE